MPPQSLTRTARLRNLIFLIIDQLIENHFSSNHYKKPEQPTFTSKSMLKSIKFYFQETAKYKLLSRRQLQETLSSPASVYLLTMTHQRIR